MFFQQRKIKIIKKERKRNQKIILTCCAILLRYKMTKCFRIYLAWDLSQRCYTNNNHPTTLIAAIQKSKRRKIRIRIFTHTHTLTKLSAITCCLISRKIISFSIFIFSFFIFRVICIETKQLSWRAYNLCEGFFCIHITMH